MRRLVVFLWITGIGLAPGAACRAELRAGAARVDAAPTKYPVFVNGGFLQAKADKALTPIEAKAIVLDDGTTRLALVVVDSCMMPRELIDKAKALAKEKTGIPMDHMMVSATHTHSAPAAMGALGCPADPGYVEHLPGRIAESIAKAAANLKPAQVGWGRVDAPEYTHTRRWIRKPDKMVVDPFGHATGRAHMHPGHRNPDAIAPSGPSDPALTLLSIRTPEGKPLAIFANYSMHYFGAGPLSADYFGRFGESLRQFVGGDASFVGIMSQGTSGDQHWMDYSRPKTDLTLDVYADALAAKALEGYRGVRYDRSQTLAMVQSKLTLRRRTPDEARIGWAKPIVEAMGDRDPKSIPEVYAKEAFYLRDEPTRELILQSIRVGDLAINAIPNEVYALTGLKLKARSPFPATMNVELANGGEGYIPPPEQHALGGYTTWPARTAALEVQAEPKIVAAVVELMGKLGDPPPPSVHARLPTHRATHFYPLEDMEGNLAADYGSGARPGRYEGAFALYLDHQVDPVPRRAEDRANHSAYLAGGRLVVPGPKAPTWRASLNFWSGLGPKERPITGTILAGDNGERLWIGGTEANPGKLVFQSAEGRVLVGRTTIEPKIWKRLEIVRNARSVEIKLDGSPEIQGETGRGKVANEFAVGGSTDQASRFEGMVDQIVLEYEQP